MIIEKLIIHCSDSDNPSHDDISIIHQWHLERGFTQIGYHFFIKTDGSIQLGRDWWQYGAHTLGQNNTSLGICLHGKKHFTELQLHTLKKLVENLRNVYVLKKEDVYGHYEFNTEKTCPNFNVKEKLYGVNYEAS